MARKHFTNTSNPIDFPSTNTKLFLITYDSADWCGGASHVVVWADSADEALYKAEDHMEETMRELFSEEYADMEQEMSDDDEGGIIQSAVSVTSVEEFGPSHEHWKYFEDESQREFYPVIDQRRFF